MSPLFWMALGPNGGGDARGLRGRPLTRRAIREAPSPIDNEIIVGYCGRVTAILVKVPRLLYPFAFALVPVLHLGAVNILEVEIQELIAPCVVDVFDRDGSVRRDLAPNLRFFGDFKRRLGADMGEKSLYVDQLVYLNSRLIEAIDAIVAAFPHPPIIIVQGDHGTSSTATNEGAGPLPRERLAILNAYFVPDQVRALLYPEITPVNSFRLILSTLFDADFPALPDRSFYSWYGHGYALRNVTGEIVAR